MRSGLSLFLLTPNQWRVTKKKEKKALKKLKAKKIEAKAKKADKKIVKKVAAKSADKAAKKVLEEEKMKKAQRTATPKQWRVKNRGGGQEASELFQPHTAAKPPSPEEELLEVSDAVNEDVEELDDDEMLF